jgi:hypothetical protein
MYFVKCNILTQLNETVNGERTYIMILMYRTERILAI